MEEERQSREYMAETKLKELEGIDDRLASRLNQGISVKFEFIQGSNRWRGKTH